MPEATTDSEIRYCLIKGVSSPSYFSSNGLSDLVRSIFPDRAIAEKFSLKNEEMSIFLINYGILPCSCSILVSNAKDSEFYAVSFDESLSTVIQMG